MAKRVVVLVVLVSVAISKGRPVRSNLGLVIGAGDGLGLSASGSAVLFGITFSKLFFVGI
jgi:hypothetical protein